MKKLTCALLCALLVSLCVTGFAAARMPADRGVLTDDADKLGAQTAQDIVNYADKLKDEADVKLHVVLVHFLDGMTAQGYADALFESWDLGGDDMLILGAAGEDSFATSLGKDVGESNAQNLMFTSSHFGELFKAQQYDAAFASYFVALNTLVEKQYDERISIDGMFAAAQAGTQATAEPAESNGTFGSQIWSEVISSIQQREDYYQDYHQTRERESGGIGIGGWIVLAIIVTIIFGQSDPARRARRQGGRDYRRYGCGCSPLGWLLNIFGVTILIDNLRNRH